MASYRLTDQALADLDRLYEYGVVTFGLLRANEYYDGLIEHFQILANLPLLYGAVDDVRAGYRRSVYRAHSVYYRIDGDGVEIVRVLGREDRDRAFIHTGSVSESPIDPYNHPQCRQVRSF